MPRLLCLAVLAACGHTAPASPDASPDGAPDAPIANPITVYAPYPPDPDTQPFSVQPGATVLFYDASGAVIDRRVTGPDGLATGNGAAGGSVTAIPPPGVTGAWYTWVDVSPDDHLYTQPVYSHVPATHSRSVILPRDGDDVDAYFVTGVGFEVGNQMPPATGTITATGDLEAGAPTHGDLVAQADHTGGTVTRFFVAHDADLTAATLDLSSATWTDSIPLDREVDHLPADTRAVEGRYWMLAGGQPLWVNAHYAGQPTTTLALHLDTPGTVGDGAALRLFYQRKTGSDAEFWNATFNGVDPTIDFSTVIPPDATGVLVQSGTTVTWQAAGDPTHAVATWLAMDAGPGSYGWLVIAPGDQRTFSPLQLPADIAPYPAVVEARVEFVAGNDPAGYAAVRTDPSAMDPEIYASAIPATPGTYRIGGR
jgi:hypothetical protein